MTDEFKYAVVCVDDDSAILQILNFQLSKIINDDTVLIECFLNPQIALTAIDELFENGLKLIFVIVDFQMPYLNGAELIVSIKEKHPQLPCIMLSGQANQSQVDNLKDNNLLTAYLEKPWTESDLKKIIDIQTQEYLSVK
jgi:two-component SAPR family response regulator